MPKAERKVVVTGEQRVDIDIVDLARVIIRFGRHTVVRLDRTQPVEEQAPEAATGDSA